MSELGLFGKIPAKGDFVRHNVVDDAARSFEQWVNESNDALRGAGGEMPDQPIRVVFTPPGSSKTVIAVMVPSQDKVGRKFPIVFFALTSAATTPQDFSAMPLSFSRFLDAAATLGHSAKEMEWDAVRNALQTLPVAGAPERAHASELTRKTLAHPLTDELHQRLFSGADGMHFYAYQTFLTACQDAAKTDPGKPSTVLDCPIHVDVDLFVWLELSRRIFGFPPAHPQYFWIEDPAPRLLLSLGPAPLNLLQFLAKPEMEHNRLWPLTTKRDKAVDSARQALSSVLSNVSASTPLSGLMDSLAQRASAGSIR